MANHTSLQALRRQRFFDDWDEFVGPERAQTSEAHVCRLIDDLLACGPELTEEAARRAVHECVRRFNDLDDGWICTIEREDIFEQIGRVIDACGFDCQQDWLDEREW